VILSLAITLKVGKSSFMNSKRYGLYTSLALITLLYFALGFISIYFALLAVVCMTLPFLLAQRAKKRIWCHSYCPRASLFSHMNKDQKSWKRVPLTFTNGKFRTYVLWYFGLNLLFMTGSTIQIALGNMAPMPYIRLFILIPFVPLPQLIHLSAPLWLTHLSYRLYSMMLSSTLLGIVLAYLYRPRSWCSICPVGTLTQNMVRQKKVISHT
jgi:hypothetical protein